MNKTWIPQICCIAAFLSLSFGASLSSAQLPARDVSVKRPPATRHLVQHSQSAAPSATAEEERPKISGRDLWELTESKVFSGDVHKISLRMNQAVWNRLHEDEKTNGCRNVGTAKWAHVRDFTFNDITMKDVAIKVRGNTSRCIPRLQFTVAFDKSKGIYTRQGAEDWAEVKYNEPTGQAIHDRTLHGLEELNLRRSYNDSSSENDSGNGMLAREFVATWAAAKTEDIARTTVRGPPVYRTVYALVEFQFCTDDADNACDKRFDRVYLVAEPLDKGFFKMRYDDEKPTVFSMAHGCALKVERGSGGLTYPCVEPEYLNGKKLNEEGAAAQLKALGYINGPQGLKARIDGAGTAADLGQILDLDSFMNYAAFATSVGHWDSAYGNFNNDVLYLHAPSGKWKLIVWDVDNTFDYGTSRGGPAHSYSYAEVANAPRLLFDKLFGISALDAQFRKRLGNYLTALYGPNGSDSPLTNKIMDVRDRYITKTNEQLATGEQQNTQRAKAMLDYAKQRLRVLRNQPRSTESAEP
jgi:hypothetical protein